MRNPNIESTPFFSGCFRQRLASRFSTRSGFYRILVASNGAMIYPILVFFAVGVSEGIIWVSVFYGILAFIILHFDLQKVTPFEIQELRNRFLISFFVVCIVSLFLEHAFRRVLQRLLNHQRNLGESENRYRQAYEQLNTQMEERKQAEKALRESEDRYRDLVECSEYLICTHDLRGQILSANHDGARLLGYDQRDLLERNYPRLISA